jgi:hypothetical protein
MLPQYIHKKVGVLDFFFLIAELVLKKRLDLENFDCCHKKMMKKKINILEFGQELGKKIGHCKFVLLFIFFFFRFYQWLI